MKKLLLSISAVSLIATASYAGKNYQEPKSEPVPVVVPFGLYVGAGLTYSHAECTCNSGKVTKGITTGFNAKIGYFFNDYLAIEGKYIYTPWREKNKTVKHYGLYLRPNLPVGENFDVYGLLGYGKTECETRLDTYKKFSWGVGAEYRFKGKTANKREGFGIYAEYLKPLDISGSTDIELYMINVGVSYHF